MPDLEERALIEALVRDFAGADPARCGEAHAQLLALGGFSRREIRDALERVLGSPPPPRPPPALPSPPARLRLPTPRTLRHIGSFELDECLGQGAFGLVYRARDLDDNAPQPLCVKVSRAGPCGAAAVPRLSQAGVITSRGVGPERVLADAFAEGREPIAHLDDLFATRVIEAEAGFVRDLDSDLFPEIYASGHADGVSYVAMERIDARDLRAHLVAGLGSLDLKRLFRRLARELAALHDRRPDFFHGDLKPENILVTPTRLRLIDPAFRGGPDDRASSTMTVPYNPLGLTGEAGDAGALVITLLELLTGVQPLKNLARPLTPSDVLDPAAHLPLDAWAHHASLDPLVAKLIPFVAHPPTLAELADALR